MTTQPDTPVSGSSPYDYPATKTVDASDTYFGVTYKDPYRWLEDLKDPEANSWYKDQADFTNAVLNNVTGRDALVAEWKKLDALKPPLFMYRDFYGGRLFYKKTMPGELVGKYYYRQGMHGAEVLLFDPTAYIPGRVLSLQTVIPSHDGKMVLLSYSEAGAEVATIKVLDVDTITFLPDTIYPSWFGPISWTFDNKAFTYSSQKTADNTDPEFCLNTKTRLHILGDDVVNDKDLLSNESYSALNIQPNELPFVSVNKDSKEYIFADISNVRSEMVTYYAPIAQFNDTIEWKVLCNQDHQLVRGMEIIGDDVYAITYKDAANYKLVHTTLKKPDWENADVVIPEKANMTLEYITHCKDYLIAIYSDGIYTSFYKYRFDTKHISEIPLPYRGSAYIKCIDNTTNDCTVGIAAWNRPMSEYEVNLETDVFLPSTYNRPPDYPEEYTDLVIEEVEVEGHDGVMIPLSIVYKKGVALDGNNVCFMNSYGAYGSSMMPHFNIMQNSLAVKNIVVAVPHVRGGSEKGQNWYKAGFKTTKPNTWKDFISCAEYLIARGFTSAGKIAGMGTSAGGILISRAITERPDLFGAAICNVGCANALRMEFSPNGPNNIPEFGTVTDSAECNALYEMDGMQHVEQGVGYPAVICIAGWNDPRVPAWQPGKFAAALQNASSSQKPVLMKVNYDNGHFTEDKHVTYANFADQYAFAMWQCGHPDFTLKNTGHS